MIPIGDSVGRGDLMHRHVPVHRDERRDHPLHVPRVGRFAGLLSEPTLLDFAQAESDLTILSGDVRVGEWRGELRAQIHTSPVCRLEQFICINEPPESVFILALVPDQEMLRF